MEDTREQKNGAWDMYPPQKKQGPNHTIIGENAYCYESTAKHSQDSTPPGPDGNNEASWGVYPRCALIAWWYRKGWMGRLPSLFMFMLTTYP